MKARQSECTPQSPSQFSRVSTRVITNPRSESVGLLRRLVESAEERARTGLFYAEGMRFVAQAQQQAARIESYVVAPNLLTHPFARRQWEEIVARGAPCLTVSAPIFRAMSQVDEPQGIGVIVRQRWDRLDRIRVDRGLCWLMLDTVRSPGNLGTILRTGDAVGSAGIILIGDSIDPYAPRVVRATMGAIFRQRFVRTTLPAFQAWKRKNDCLWVATSPHATDEYRDLEYRSPTILWMGGERKGLSGDAQALCDRTVRIPMVGAADSLNLAVATSVLFYEVFHQRRKGG